MLLKDGLVCRRRVGEAVALVIPQDDELRQEIMRVHHDLPTAGHLSLQKTIKAIT